MPEVSRALKVSEKTKVWNNLRKKLKELQSETQIYVDQVIMDLDLGPEAEPHRGAVVIIPVCEQLIPNRKDGGVKPSMCSYSAQTY